MGFGSGERKREQIFLLWTQLEELPTEAGCGCRLTHTLEREVGAERTAGEECRAHGLQEELLGIPGGWFPTGNIATDHREGGRRGGHLGTLSGLGSASSGD